MRISPLVLIALGMMIKADVAYSRQADCPGHRGEIPRGLQLQSRVAPERAADFENVCHLTVRRTVLGVFGDTNLSTGMLYRGRYLLTAAHNVYSPWFNRVSSIEVRCGKADVRGVPLDATASARGGAVADGYRWGLFSRGRFEHDFAVVRLDRTLATSSPATIATAPPRQGQTVRLAGYPGDDFCDAKILHTGDGRVTDPDGPVIEYDIKTYTGNSGGPVFAGPDSNEVLAIHVRPSGARLVTQAEVDQMIQRLEAEPRRP